VTTLPGGGICFGVSAPGTYTITEIVLPGWTPTTPTTQTVTVPPSPVNVFFGNKRAGVCDREIKKTVTPNPVASSGTVTVTLTVTNVGTAPCPVVAGVNVADPKPAGMTFNPPVSVNNPGWSCGISGPSGTWPGGVQCTATSPLLPGAANAVTITFTATVTAPPGSQIQNCAEVTNVGDDADQTNNKSCVTIQVGGPPCKDVTINLSTGQNPNWTVSPGTAGVITNLGPLSGTWVAPTAPVRWIQPANASTPQLLPGGFYQYSVSFILPGPLNQYSSISLSGRYAADNTVHQFFVSLGQSAPGGPLCTPANANCFSAWTSFSIAAATAFTAGLNSLNVRVYNNPTGPGDPPPGRPTYTGLVVEATLQAKCKEKTPGGPINLRSFDTNGNGTIDDPEFFDIIDSWIAEQIDDPTFFQAIDLWISQGSIPAARLEPQTTLSVDLSKRGATFVAHGQGISSMGVQVFSLDGRRLFAQETPGTRLIWNLNAQTGEPVANGVYLYVVRMRGLDGSESVSEVRKLVILR
jgi:hypothetical protein